MRHFETTGRRTLGYAIVAAGAVLLAGCVDPGTPGNAVGMKQYSRAPATNGTISNAILDCRHPVEDGHTPRIILDGRASASSATLPGTTWQGQVLVLSDTKVAGKHNQMPMWVSGQYSIANATGSWYNTGLGRPSTEDTGIHQQAVTANQHITPNGSGEPIDLHDKWDTYVFALTVRDRETHTGKPVENQLALVCGHLDNLTNYDYLPTTHYYADYTPPIPADQL